MSAFLFAALLFAQKKPKVCPCDSSNIIATGKINFVQIKKYSARLITYNYKSDMVLSNTTQCTMDIKSVTIDDKTTYLNLVINTIGEQKRVWISEFSHLKPLLTKAGKAKVWVEYKLNETTCRQQLVVAIDKP